VGAQVYDFEGVPRRLMACIQDQVTALPPGQRVIGTKPVLPLIAALRYGDLATDGEAHPNMAALYRKGLIERAGAGVRFPMRS